MSTTLTGRVPQLCPALGAPRRSRAPAEAAGVLRGPTCSGPHQAGPLCSGPHQAALFRKSSFTSD